MEEQTIKKASKAELVKEIINLQAGYRIDFCTDVCENLEEKYTESDGIGWYCAEKTTFYDSKIILIGGYGNHTVCVNDDEYGRADLPAIVKDFFKYEPIGECCYYFIRNK